MVSVMTSNPDELERAVERLTALATDLDYAAMPTKPDVVTLCGGYAAEARDDLRLILSANREMRDSLRPFAALADFFDGWDNPLPDESSINHGVTVGHLRKARSALTTQRGDGE